MVGKIDLVEQLVVVFLVAEIDDDELRLLQCIAEKFRCRSLPFNADSLPALSLASRLRRTGAAGTSGRSAVHKARQETLHAQRCHQRESAKQKTKFHGKSFPHRTYASYINAKTKEIVLSFYV